MVNASVAAEALLSLMELLLVGLDAHRALLLGAFLAGLRRAAQPSLLAPCPATTTNTHVPARV